jgi:hypothetical protein
MGLGDLFRRKKEEDVLNTELSPTTPGMNLDQGMNDPLNSGNSFNPSMDSMNSANLSNMGMVNQGFQQGNDLQKDIQIISLKLDSIKSELDAMNQRIKNIEAIAQKEQGGQRQKWY